LQFEISGETTKMWTDFAGSRLKTRVSHPFLLVRALSRPADIGARKVAAEFPVLIDNTALRAVPDYRFRGGISFHF
jgi:hypothetical protein